MSYTFDKEYTLDLFCRLTNTHSVAGDTREGTALLAEEMRRLGCQEIHFSNKGAVYCRIEGMDDEHQVLVNAHIDTLGLMVSQIRPNGRLLTSQIGGFTWQTYEGENCTVRTSEGEEYTGTLLYEKPSVHNFKVESRSTERDASNMEIRLDEDVHSKEETAALGIAPGDFVWFEPRTVIAKNGFIKSRYIDDKACLAVMFDVLRSLQQSGTKPAKTTWFYVADYEEIGHGVSVFPEKVTEIVSLDIGPAGIGHTSDEHCVSIAAKDAFTPYSFPFRLRLQQLAKKVNADYRVDVYNAYGSDASKAVYSSRDVDFACFGPGTDATHHYERTHVDALENTAKLLHAYLTEK